MYIHLYISLYTFNFRNEGELTLEVIQGSSLVAANVIGLFLVNFRRPRPALTLPHLSKIVYILPDPNPHTHLYTIHKSTLHQQPDKFLLALLSFSCEANSIRERG